MYARRNGHVHDSAQITLFGVEAIVTSAPRQHAPIRRFPHVKLFQMRPVAGYLFGFIEPDTLNRVTGWHPR